MIVTLAYTYEGHQPDETIDVADHVGRSLVRDGLARLPAADVFADQTVEELRAYAADHTIDLGGAKKKTDIVAAIRDAETAAIPPISPISTPAPVDVET